MLDYITFAAGLALLLIAGDLLVRGAVGIADRLSIPPLVIGLTVVAFGTSAPELVVCVQAALDGAPDIAIGNVVGSNIANVLLVMGVPALIAPTVTQDRDAVRNTIYMIGATMLFIGICFSGEVTRLFGAILFTLLLIFLWESVRGSRNGTSELEQEIADLEGPAKKLGIAVAFTIGGVIGLPIAASLMVDSARSIAMSWGVSEAAIGLTIVALGTSLPELAATVMAAIRREGAIAIGNVIGSNIFNLFGIMGLTALVSPIPIPEQVMHLDIWVMLATALLVLVFVGVRLRIGKRIGATLVIAYLLYGWTVFEKGSVALAG